MIKAEIHPNIHLIKAGESKCISVRHMRKHARVKHMAAVMLGNVEFVVQESGRKRAVEEQAKNVHAFARGNLTGEFEEAISWDSLEIPETIKSRFREVTYHYNVGHFFDAETKDKVTAAKAVVALGKKYYYLP